MAPKGGNAKKEAGRAKKAENEAKKQAAADGEKVSLLETVAAPKLMILTDILKNLRERKEASKWDTGAKGKSAKDDKEAKRKETLAAKAERDRLLAEEESSAPTKKATTPKVGAKKKAGTTAKPAGPGAIAAGGGLAATASQAADEEKRPEEIESYAATGVDNVLELMEVVNAKTDKASMGSRAAGIERHPEVCVGRSYDAILNLTQCTTSVASKPLLRLTRIMRCRKSSRRYADLL